MRRQTLAGIVAFLVGIGGLSVSASAVSKRNHAQLLEALLTAPIRTVYHEDGASDATITAVPMDNPTRQDAPAEVRAILDLGPRSLPLLIDSLDDRRLTQVRFDGGGNRNAPIQVPLGFLCLDILLHATSQRSAPHHRDCADDGLGACVKAGYYFRPDVLQEADGPARMQEVKRRWQQALWARRLSFEYPTWVHRG